MNCRKLLKKLWFLPLLLVLGACSSETPFEPAAVKNGPDVVGLTGSPTVPFHDDIYTTISFIPPFPDPPTQPFSNFIIRGTGISSHLGRSQIFEESQYNVMTGVQTGFGAATGAGGMELWYEYEGTGTEPDVNGVLSFSGAVTFTGGTGIFEGATGEGTYYGTASVVANTGHRIMDAELILTLPGDARMDRGR